MSTKLVLLGGLSGSGKSGALNMLEDLGYHTVDNLPLPLVPELVTSTVGSGEARFARLAVGVDPKSTPEEFERLAERVREWRSAPHGCTVVYLHTHEATLTKRYSETRRRHPLAGGGRDLAAAIAAERERLAPLAELADVNLDTSDTNVHELRELIRKRVAAESGRPMTLMVESFAYRTGIPQNADLVFDMRCLPNPYWEPELRDQTGLDADVVNYLERDPMVTHMLAELERFLVEWIPTYSTSNRSYLTIAIGCTGGLHRSVYIAERLAERFACQSGWRVIVKHWKLGREGREIIPTSLAAANPESGECPRGEAT